MKKSLDATEIESLEVPGLGLVTKGLEVTHPIFGQGTVIALFCLPPSGLVTHSIGINFISTGYKALSPEHAKLSLK